MATYAVGDLQGCFQPLRCLLQQVDFQPGRDRLWAAGDMINRGPDSLGCLRFLRDLGDSVVAVLGNHDLHFLAVRYGSAPLNPSDTLDELLAAPDCDELASWLRRCKLLHNDPDLGYTMVHAGIPPQWNLAHARDRALELEAVLRDDSRFESFLGQMYGNQPDQWQDSLDGYDRLRVITNYFTRMRFCTPEGQLDLKAKSGPDNPPRGHAPWFTHRQRRTAGERIVFGHWAALEGRADTANIYALDTGCVWGGQLTMMRLEDGQYFRCDC